MAFTGSDVGPPDPWYTNYTANHPTDGGPFAGAPHTPPAALWPGGGGGGGGGAPQMPDWQSLLNNNPYYLAAQAMAQQQLAALRAQMGGSAARALVNLGDASLASQVKGLNIPGETAGLVDKANQAGTSVLSRLTYAHNQNAEQIPAGLAGRGFYRSGETGHELQAEDRSYGLKQGDARSQTLDYLNSLYDNYVNAQFGIQQNVLGAYFSAYQMAMNQIMSGQYGSTTVSGGTPDAPGVPAGNVAGGANTTGIDVGSPDPWYTNHLANQKTGLGAY